MTSFDDIPENYRYKLLNSKQLAEALGVSDFVIRAIKLAGAEFGDSPFCGIYAFLVDVIAWLRKHKKFVASHFHDAEKRRRGRQKRRFRKPKNEPQDENKSEQEGEMPDSNDAEA